MPETSPTAKFIACLTPMLAYEGDFSSDPRDPGNWTGGKRGVGTLKGTKKGVAASTHPALDIKNLTDAQIASIYAAEYWRPIRGEDLPVGVDLATFDYGVNSGPAQASRDLQRVVGVPVDGKIGPVTLMAVVLADRPATIKGLYARRLSLLQSLKIWQTFSKGWLKRLTAGEALSLSMVLAKPQLDVEAKKANSTAVGQGATGAAVGGGAVLDHGDLTGLPPAVIIAAAVLIVAILAIRTIINRQRAMALAAAAQGA